MTVVDMLVVVVVVVAAAVAAAVVVVVVVVVVVGEAVVVVVVVVVMIIILFTAIGLLSDGSGYFIFIQNMKCWRNFRRVFRNSCIYLVSPHSPPPPKNNYVSSIPTFISLNPEINY